MNGINDLLVLLLVLVGSMILGQWVRRFLMRNQMIDPREVNERMQRGEDILILDVRTPEEFANRAIPGAVNMPLAFLPRRISEVKGDLDAYRDTPVVLVCRSDNRAIAAYRHMRRTNLSDVKIMRGGMSRWHSLGLPVTGSV